MKYLPFILMILVASVLSPRHAMLQTTCKKYGGDEIDYASQMIRDPAGNLIFTGRTYSFLVDSTQIWGDIYTIKLDQSYNLVWSSVFQTTLEDEGNAITCAHDGGYLVAGASFDWSKGYDISLVKLDTGGNLSWNRHLGTSLNEKAQVIRKTSDDAYIMAGYCDSIFTGQAQAFIPMIAKVSLNGSVIWARKFGLSNGVFAGSVYDVFEVPDGSFIVTGDIIRMFQGPDDSDIFIARFSSSGTLLWFKWLGSNCQGCQEMGAFLIQKDQGSFTCIASDGPGSGLYLCTFDIYGNILHELMIPTGYFAYTNISTVKTIDNGLVITCTAASGILIIRLDSAYSISWASVYGDGPGNIACTILDNGDDFIIGGYTGSTGQFREDYFLAELDAHGNSCCKITDLNLMTGPLHLQDSSGGTAWSFSLADTIEGSTVTGGDDRLICPLNSVAPGLEQYQPVIHPNPFNDHLLISFWDKDRHLVQITSVAGQIVATIPAGDLTEINTSAWPPGLYLVSIDGATFRKVIRK